MFSGLTIEDWLFHGFAGIATVSALLVVFMANPIYSALFLALAMSVLGALFFMLEAYFISVAQITVYAGAVMVLFVMVVMLFDLRHEGDDILKFSPMTLIKVLVAGLLCGFFIGTGWLAVTALSSNPATMVAPSTTAQNLDLKTKALPESQRGPKVEVEKEGGPEVQTAAQNEAKVEANEDEDLTSAEAAALVVDQPNSSAAPAEEFGSTVSLSRRLFTNYVFAFEAVSLLLLVAIVGSVALAKSKGGTHHVG